MVKPSWESASSGYVNRILKLKRSWSLQDFGSEKKVWCSSLESLVKRGSPVEELRPRWATISRRSFKMSSKCMFQYL